MRFLHSMVRISDIDESLHFYCALLGLKETRRIEFEEGRFTLIFLAAPKDYDRAVREKSGELELTYNWDEPDREGLGANPASRHFGHLAYKTDDIYALCDRLKEANIIINRPPRDGRMAFVKSPDNISIELLQEGEPLEPREPWISMENEGVW